MKKSLLFFSIITLYWSQCKAQDINSLYINYFQNTRELPYLHLNKTSFLKGEDIWFQSYVIEQNSNTLHPTTSNLYVSVFDESGNQKEQHLVHIKNGVGYGNITIDSTFTKDAYYLKASTNWMKNFNEDQAFTQKIAILSDQEKESSKSLTEDQFFEFKLFPEGGHLLSNTINTVGVLIKDANNKGVEITDGKIKDQSGAIVGEFTTNSLGLASASIAIKNNQIYTFEATLPNGTVLTEKTSLPKQSGITLNTAVLDDSFVLNILTNNTSLAQLNGKKYRVLTHNTRSFKNIFFDFNTNDKTYALILKKDELPKGINIITIFNENNIPIIERLIFNEFEGSPDQFHISNSKVKYDSITTKLINNSNKRLFLSASFLPPDTKAYKPDNTIKSQTLLNPYVKGFIENPQHYFNDNYQDLDLLLLTQGWSKYSWNNIFNNPPNDYFNFENGIDLTATFNKKIKPNQSVLIYSKTNNLIREINSSQNPLELKNTFIKKNSTIDFGLKSNDNIYKIAPYIQYGNSEIKDSFNKENLTNYKNIELEVSNFKDLSKDVTVLDEVILQGNKRKMDNKPFGGITMLRAIKMENIIVPSGETIIEFFKYKGFGYTPGIGFSPRGINTDSRQISTFNSEGQQNGATAAVENNNNEAPSLRRKVRVFLDDEEVTYNIWVIENINTNMVKEVFYGREPGRIEQFIHIYLLSPQEYSSNRAELSTVKVPIGFATEKEYYSPKYPSYSNETFKDYGAIYWQPNIVVDPNSSLSFSVPRYYQREAKVFIEGISENGELISKTQLLILD